MRFYALPHRSSRIRRGFFVSVLGLPGCWSQGSTEVEAIENIKDALREYMEIVNEQLRDEEVREIEIAL